MHIDRGWLPSAGVCRRYGMAVGIRMMPDAIDAAMSAIQNTIS